MCLDGEIGWRSAPDKASIKTKRLLIGAVFVRMVAVRALEMGRRATSRIAFIDDGRPRFALLPHHPDMIRTTSLPRVSLISSRVELRSLPFSFEICRPIVASARPYWCYWPAPRQARGASRVVWASAGSAPAVKRGVGHTSVPAGVRGESPLSLFRPVRPSHCPHLGGDTAAWR